MSDCTTIPYSLGISNGDPVDRRLVLTKAEMLAMKPVKMPRSDIDKYFALCSDDNQFYVYDKNATPNAETGRFVPMMTASPVPTDSTAGPVKSCSDTDSITVNSDGTMSVNQISIDKLTDSVSTVLVLNGGSAPEAE